MDLSSKGVPHRASKDIIWVRFEYEPHHHFSVTIIEWLRHTQRIHRDTKPLVSMVITPSLQYPTSYSRSIFRDPDIFPDPERFDPQRWLTPDGTIRSDIKNYNFGFGRRVCPAMHVANRYAPVLVPIP